MPEALNGKFAERFTITGKAKDEQPRHLGTRFNAGGEFLLEPGNTVVAHVKRASPSMAALLRLRAALKAMPHASHFAWTPPSSYHMTLFQGTIEFRRKPLYWPEPLGLGAPIADTTRFLAGQLNGLPPIAPLRTKLKEITPLGLVVEGYSAPDERLLRQARDDLAERFHYRHPDHETYTFHITMAYLKEWLPADATEVYVPALAKLTTEFAAEVPFIDLGPAEFCTFNDMNHFEPVLRLA